MSIDHEVRAIRASVALSDAAHIAAIRVRGSGAFEAMDRLCPRELFVRDGQMLQTLFLHDDGRPLADVLLCRDDEDFVLLAEGPPAADLLAWMRARAPREAAIELCDLGEDHVLLSLDGPYAWELLGELAEPSVIGLPYLNFYREQGWTCFRSGKTGEYGYLLLVPVDAAPGLRARIEEKGRRYDLGAARLEALDQCALENFFFNVRREGQAAATPLELQLQWRVSYGKEYPGAAALRARRAAGPARRLACVVGDGPFAAGARLALAGQVVGNVVNAGRSSVREDTVGLALIDVEWALPGVEGLTVDGAPEGTAVRTVSPPVIDNRSLYVNPQRHSYLTRDGVTFPPLVRGGLRGS